jgi:hypothetical protein
MRCSCLFNAGLKQLNQASTGGAGQRAAGYTIGHREISWPRRIDLTMLTHTTLMHPAMQKHSIFVMSFVDAALTVGVERDQQLKPKSDSGT